MGRAIGIDLGTTNSCVAVITERGPEVVRHRGGRSLIPSVYAVDKRGRELIGEDARKQAALNPDNTVVGAKRFIGRQKDSDAVRALESKINYRISGDNDGDVAVMVQGQAHSLVEVSSILLTKIKESTQEAIEDFVTDAVITVPAYFNDNQRSAVRKAGAKAGLNVLRVLNEPTAAALAYGSGKGRTETVAVFDLGGGTFDLSVIRVDGQMFEVLATGGDTMLGGLDFDRRIVEMAVRDFKENHGIDLHTDNSAMARVQEAAEAAKINLSTGKTAAINLPFVARGSDGPLNMEFTFTREDLENNSKDLVQRTLMTVRAIVKDAGMEPKDIDEVLLVGGQTRMPLIQKALTEFFGKAPSKNVHPDEAVAVGAALMADLLVSGREDAVTLVDVLPQTIGLGLPNGKFHPIFKKFTPVPAVKNLTLTTAYDNQRSLELQMYQGESGSADRNTPLGKFEFTGIRPGPAGSVKVQVVLQLDSQGILELSAKDRDTGEPLTTRLKLPPGKQGAMQAQTATAATSSAAGNPPPDAGAPSAIRNSTDQQAITKSPPHKQTPAPPPPAAASIPGRQAVAPTPEQPAAAAQPEAADPQPAATEQPAAEPARPESAPGGGRKPGLLARFMSLFRRRR